MSQAAADALVREGDELLRTESFTGAAERFKRAVSVFPHHALGWRGLGHALLFLGMPHDAAGAFDQAVGLRPDSATALWGGAIAHAEVGNKVVARDYLRRSLALQPTWIAMAADTPQLAVLLHTSARAADRLQTAFGAFSTRRFQHASHEGLIVEVGRLADLPAFGTHTFVTIGLSNTEWNEPERPRVELIMASSHDLDACSQILANLAFHLIETRFFPEPGTMVRDVVAALGVNDLSKRLPHIYVGTAGAWNIELPLDVGPPAITLARVFPLSEREYQQWRELGAIDFERALFEREVDVADLSRAG